MCFQNASPHPTMDSMNSYIATNPVTERTAGGLSPRSGGFKTARPHKCAKRLFVNHANCCSRSHQSPLLPVKAPRVIKVNPSKSSTTFPQNPESASEPGFLSRHSRAKKSNDSLFSKRKIRPKRTSPVVRGTIPFSPCRVGPYRPV